MMRTLLVALCASVAFAFVAPTSSVSTATRPVSTVQHFSPVELSSAIAQNTMLLADESDFGGAPRLPVTCLTNPAGYFFPVVGLTLLSAIIVFLSPPLKDD
mmetsp:Transcript_12460/g.40759  ORF Transcript_12460/g.40759 Transcript_12460/m.40759 type:complete len:101 (+) Transcript_12460:112-414(+)